VGTSTEEGGDVTETIFPDSSVPHSGRRIATNAREVEALLGNAPVAFALIRPEGTAVEANQAFASAFGLPDTDVRGRHLRDLAGGLWARLEPLARWVAVTGEPVSDLELSAPVPNDAGLERDWLVGLHPVCDGADRFEELGVLAVDITARKRAERELRVLARASSLYTETPLELPRLLDRAGRLAIPEFADACIVFCPSSAAPGRRAALVHRDPKVEARLRNFAARLPPRAAPYGAAGRAMETGRAQLVEHLTDDQRQSDTNNPEHLALLRLLDVQSSITVPLRFGERSTGALTLMYTSASGRRYRRDDFELARELGCRTAQLVESLRLGEEAARVRARLDLLARLGELLTVDLDLDARLHEIVRIVLPDLGDAAGIYLLEGDELQLVVAGHRDPERNEALRAATLPSHPVSAELPPSQALRTGRPIVIADVPLFAATALIGSSVPPADLRAPLRSMMAVPLEGAGGPIGVLSVASTRSRREYSHDEVRLAVEIARRISPAVVQSQRYEQEREIIEVLQRSLLPAELPRLSGLQIVGRYLPGTEGLRIGGDWYDAHALADGTLLLAIGDVVGHGVRAASAMGHLRVALQIYASERLEPAAILERLNRHFADAAEREMATLAVLLFDPTSGRLAYASAGHPPPAVRDADGTVEFLAEPGGPPICATRAPRFPQYETVLAAGSCLALYTDGLVERRGESLDEGLARLAKLIEAHEGDANSLADAIIEHRAPEGTDDVALLVVELDRELAPLVLTLDAQPRFLRHLRHTLEHWLRRAGLTGDEIAEISVAANEAVANAIEHAYGPGDAHVVFTADISHGALHLSVKDFGVWRPSRATGGGRGLELMQHLMDDVVVDALTPGTEVRMRRRLRRFGSER
jgi:PAS domain S-box-containing protein